MGNVGTKNKVISDHTHIDTNLKNTLAAFDNTTDISLYTNIINSTVDTDEFDITDTGSNDYTRLSLLINSTRTATITILPDVRESYGHTDNDTTQSAVSSIKDTTLTIQPSIKSKSVIDLHKLRKHMSASPQKPSRTTTNTEPRQRILSPHHSDTLLQQFNDAATDELLPMLQARTASAPTILSTPRAQSAGIEYDSRRNSDSRFRVLPTSPQPQRGSITQLQQERRNSFSVSRHTLSSTTQYRVITDRPVLTRLSDEWKKALMHDPLLYVSPEFAEIYRSCAHIWYKYCAYDDIHMNEQSLQNLCTDVMKLYIRELSQHINKHKRYNESQLQAVIDKHLLRHMQTCDTNQCEVYLSVLFRQSIDVDQNGDIERYEFIDQWPIVICALFDTIKSIRTITCDIM